MKSPMNPCLKRETAKVQPFTRPVNEEEPFVPASQEWKIMVRNGMDLKTNIYVWLVVEPYPSEEYEFVNWDDDSPNIWQNKKPCSKPPTRCLFDDYTINHVQPYLDHGRVLGRHI